MAHAVMIKHKPSGLVKTGYYGFSWTYLFFGFLVPCVRGEVGIGALHFLLSVLTVFIFQLVMPFLYNRQYMTRMLTSGWELADTEEKNQKAKLALGIVTS